MTLLRALFGLCAALSASSTLGCTGTTGGDLFTFDAAAAGPADADPGGAFTFSNGRGYEVTLTRADVHLGAVYLNRALPVSGAQATTCTLPGVYVAEVTRGLVVNALSPEEQPFPVQGEGLADHAVAGEVWLAGDDVNAQEDTTVILDVAGTAQKGGMSYPFEGKLTIGANRIVPVSDPAQPGANPICKQRIVSPIPVALDPRAGGHLLVRVDPRGFFPDVEFSELDQVNSAPPLYGFEDETVNQPSVSLYNGLRAREGTYQFFWIPGREPTTEGAQP